ncbi:alpha/beta fold hydrolase [Candidatus Obscuribacterales bacterium]|nr:alpha/beta fold hydrolase [Candidatus Obscuribacterales bacterium]
MATRKTLSTVLSIFAAATFAVSHQSASAEPVRDDNASLGKELRLPIYYWNDSAVKTKGVILAIHGVTLHARRFDSVAMKLAADGYPVYALDLRGFGAWRKDNEKFNGDDKIHYTQSQGDIVDVLSTLKKMYSDVPLYMMGESLGANLSVWVASTHPDLVDGIILSSPCVKRIVRLNKRVLIDSTKSFFHPYKPFGLEAHIKPYLSEDPRVTEEYLQDPYIDMDLSAADLIKSVKTNTLAIANTKSIPEDMPILMLAGEQDKIYKAKAIPKFAKNIPSHDQTIYIFENKGHLLLEHNFVEPDVIARMENWLAEQHKRDGKSGEIAEHNSKSVFSAEQSTTGSGETGGSGSPVGPSSLITPAPPTTTR